MIKRIGTSLVAVCALACASEPQFHGIDVSSGQSIDLKHPRKGQTSTPTACVAASPNSEPPFEGTYLSPQFGTMNLVGHDPAKIKGTFQYHSCGCEVAGMIQGSVEGNLMSFTWTEDAPQCRGGWHTRGRGRLFLGNLSPTDPPLRLFGNHAYLVDVIDAISGKYHIEVRDAGVLTAVRLAPGEIGPADLTRCP